MAQAGGFLPYSDTTPADVLRSKLHMSKTTFKAAVGMLLRSGHVSMVPGEGVYLLSARASVLRRVQGAARAAEENVWRQKVKVASLAAQNEESLRAPPVMPGSAGVDRRRFKTIQRQAKEKREELLGLPRSPAPPSPEEHKRKPRGPTRRISAGRS